MFDVHTGDKEQSYLELKECVRVYVEEGERERGRERERERGRERERESESESESESERESERERKETIEKHNPHRKGSSKCFNVDHSVPRVLQKKMGSHM